MLSHADLAAAEAAVEAVGPAEEVSPRAAVVAAAAMLAGEVAASRVEAAAVSPVAEILVAADAARA